MSGMDHLLGAFAGPTPTTIGRDRGANKANLRVGVLASAVDRCLDRFSKTTAAA
jgi:hypothetical protein